MSSQARPLLQHHDLAGATEASSDKAKVEVEVEVEVEVAERWLLARIRNEIFTSLADLNRRLFELAEIINTRPMRTYNASRRELFERLDKPALRPLPEPFQASSWKEVRLNTDYQIEFDHHLYSAENRRYYANGSR